MHFIRHRSPHNDNMYDVGKYQDPYVKRKLKCHQRLLQLGVMLIFCQKAQIYWTLNIFYILYWCKRWAEYTNMFWCRWYNMYPLSIQRCPLWSLLEHCFICCCYCNLEEVVYQVKGIYKITNTTLVEEWFEAVYFHISLYLLVICGLICSLKKPNNT